MLKTYTYLVPIEVLDQSIPYLNKDTLYKSNKKKVEEKLFFIIRGTVISYQFELIITVKPFLTQLTIGY